MSSRRDGTETAADERIVDFSAHYIPESVYPAEAYAEYERQGSSFVPILEDLDEYSHILTRAGIDVGVLSNPISMGGGDADRVGTANDALLAVATECDRFYALASIPVAAGGEVAAAELERCLGNGFQGGALETKSGGVELVDDDLLPVFEVAERNGAPIFVHPKLHDSVAPGALEETYALNSIFGREVALAESVCKVIHAGVLDRFPGLNVVYHHFGGNLSGMLGRIHNHLDPGRWPTLQEHVKPYDAFKTQLEDRIYLDTAGFFGYPGPLQAALDAVPATQLLFGTDFPYEPRTAGDLEAYLDPIRDLASPDDTRAILGENALELLVNT